MAVARRRANPIEAVAVHAIDSHTVVDPLRATGACVIDGLTEAVGHDANAAVLASRCTARARTWTFQASETASIDEAASQRGQRDQRTNPKRLVNAFAHASMKQNHTGPARVTCVIL